jgi:outer membrane biosynthesis protein TonB
MIEKENNTEEPVLKIEDKRKFNPDGTLREGVVIEKEKPKTETKVETPIYEPDKKTVETYDEAKENRQSKAKTETAAATQTAEEPDEEDIMNDENPASFVNFLSTLVTNAAASLGAMPHPVTGQKSVDLETGKYWIDVLSMLREKTNGNLSSQEQSLLESILGDLQMQYVHLTKATEEKLKAQAAQKFSGKDILGG